MRLLLVEDEAHMAEALKEVLLLEKYEVDYCEDGVSGQYAALNGVYDVIVLDVMLPGINGFDIAKAIRKAEITTPILMLTAKSELDDKVMGLDNGADDYLTKPFMIKELLARLRALCRRGINASDGVISFGDLALDTYTATLRCVTTGQTVRLSEKEFRLIECFLHNPGHLLSKEQIAVKIWGYEDEAEYNKVEVYLSFTRKKLAFIGSTVEIKAVRGLGYEMRTADV